MAAEQTSFLGRYSEAVEETIARLKAAQCVRRLWDNDPTLWSADPQTQQAIRQRLGWLTIPRAMAQRTDSLRQVAQEIRQAGFTQGLLLGMGGSGLFAEVCRNTFGVAAGFPDLTVLDTTDPTAIRAHQRRAPLRQLFVIVSSKSGTTSEVAALSKYFYEAFRAAEGAPGAHGMAITDSGTPLEAQAVAWRFQHLFTHGPGTGLEVGGRFSALTYFGLVPAALLGIDVDRLLGRAIEMLDRCGPSVPVREHPAAQLGAALGALAQAGQDKLTLLFAPSLASVGTWVEQLIAESTGKRGRGIVPVQGEPRREPTAYDADRVFVELQLGTQVDRALDEHVRALIASGHPVIRIRWQDLYDLGGEVAKWCMATAIAGHVMEINPFDEPNVKESKDSTTALLDEYAREGRFRPEGAERYADAGVAVYGTERAAPCRSLSHCFEGFFRQVRPADYVALLSFLPRTEWLDRAVLRLRNHLSLRCGRPTMAGFGPRYLHSTGQLYKGGADTGVFLLFTGEEREDLPIPGEPWTFGVLKQAQALGDFRAMRQRRILRLHLRGDLEAGLQRIGRAIDEALSLVEKHSPDAAPLAS